MGLSDRQVMVLRRLLEGQVRAVSDRPNAPWTSRELAKRLVDELGLVVALGDARAALIASTERYAHARQSASRTGRTLQSVALVR